MVRIVSGQRSDPNEALLQGMELGKGFRQAQMARQEAQAQQMNQALRMQEIQMRFQKARAEQEEAIAKAAQMGDVRAQRLAVLRSQLKESDKMSQDLLKVGEGITDPDAFDDLMKAGEPLIKQKQQQERTEAFEVGLQDALKDGLIDEAGVESARTRVASGEEPEKILQEFATVRFKNAKAAAAVQENAKFVEQARMLAESAPTPEAKRKAMIPLTVYEQSPAAQEKPGSGARMFGEVMKAANAGRDEQIAQYVSQRKDAEFLTKLSEGMKAREDQFGEQITPTGKGYGQNVFPSDKPFEQPRTTAMQTHIGKQRAAKEKRYPGSTTPQPFVGPMPERKSLKQKEAEAKGQPTKATGGLPTSKIKAAKTEGDVVDALLEAGVPITDANIDAAKEVWRGGGR